MLAEAAAAMICVGPQAENVGGGVPGGVINAPPICSRASAVPQDVAGEGAPVVAHAPPIVSIASAGVGACAQTLAVGGGRVGVVGDPRGTLVQSCFFGMAWTCTSLPDVWL